MLIHKNNKIIKNRDFKWPNREKECKSVMNVKSPILHPENEKLDINVSFADK